MSKAVIGFCVALTLAAGAVMDSTLSAQQPAPKTPAAKGPNATPWPDAAGMAKRREEAQKLPLFQSNDVLAITLIADFKAVNKDRNPNSTKLFPGKIEFQKDDKSTASLPIELRTRGHVRRMYDICIFAPLRLELPKDQLAGTVFAGQHTLKLGTHCKDVGEYEQYVLREYAANKVLGALTPNALRLRLTMVTYMDAKEGKPMGKPHYGILYEDNDDLAKRMDGRITEEARLPFGRLDAKALDFMMLFEYFIGNTDVSIFGNHNVHLVQNQVGTIFPIPYDFDYSGLVNTAYAIPVAALGIGSVRERLYRGACRNQADWEPLIAHFKDKRKDMEAVYDTVPNLNPGYKKDALNYIDSFFKSFDKPDQIKKALIDKCLKEGVM